MDRNIDPVFLNKTEEELQELIRGKQVVFTINYDGFRHVKSITYIYSKMYDGPLLDYIDRDDVSDIKFV